MIEDQEELHSTQQRHPLWRRLGTGGLGFMLFLVALMLMKDGAKGLEPLLQNHLQVTNAADSLGFGWLSAAVILSGSPIAAASVAMLSAGTLQTPQAFTMITGSRMGASLVVLLLGFLYALRERERWTALTAGVLSLLIVGSAQLLALPVGLWMLNWRRFNTLSLPALERLAGGMNRGMSPLLTLLGSFLPEWALFLTGVGLAMFSFRLFDRALPQMQLKGTELGQINRLVYRPEIMFLMGLVVTLITMSVSVSVGILVPLSARGYVRRENIIPYILGANISTLGDTLLAAALLGHSEAVAVVLVQMIAVTLVSLPIAVLLYWPYERAISRGLNWITRSRRNFTIFLSIVLLIPILLILL